MLEKYEYEIPTYPEYILDYLIPFLIYLRFNFAASDRN